MGGTRDEYFRVVPLPRHAGIEDPLPFREARTAGFLSPRRHLMGTDLMQNYLDFASSAPSTRFPSPPRMEPQTTHLLYLHGFRSSPRSTKARAVADRVAQRHPNLHWWCPQLPPSPKDAIDMVMKGIADWPRKSMAVVGSSLGGFYATYVAGMTRCRAVLLNPAVHPARDLTLYIGDQSAWHDPAEHFYFRPEYIHELRAMEVGSLTRPERVFAVIAKGDEVLDWHEMSARYADSRVKLIEGGDHALSDFKKSHLDDVMAFINPVQ